MCISYKLLYQGTLIDMNLRITPLPLRRYLFERSHRISKETLFHTSYRSIPIEFTNNNNGSNFVFLSSCATYIKRTNGSMEVGNVFFGPGIL